MASGWWNLHTQKRGACADPSPVLVWQLANAKAAHLIALGDASSEHNDVQLGEDNNYTLRLIFVRGSLWFVVGGCTVSITTNVWAICVCIFHVACLPGRSTLTVRILITVSPLMYREALALAIHRHCPDFELRIAPPEDTYEEVGRFNPHLLVRADNDGFDPLLLEHILNWVEVMYTDSMNARVSVDGTIEEVSDMALDDLLKVIDEAEQFLLRGKRGTST